jgi:DNA-binding NtrC family response regulator
VLVRDLQSKNGTFVNGVRVQEAVLDRPGPLELGKVVLRVSWHDDDAGAAGEADTFAGIVGVAPAMRRVFGLLARVAPTTSTVLLLGETGTGKEAFAQALHRASPRAAAPFVVVDCGAIAPQLIESELFGHVKGAFTGATSDRKGAFQAADGGTLFLDEIGELPLELQPRLLRALEAGTVKRLGDTSSRQVDVRVVAATHRDLHAEVKQGRFRQDLLFRLDVVTVRIPPLRERREDLPLLVKHFVAQLGRPDFALSPPALARLQAWSWPGNVRELRNVLERALVSDDALLPPDAEAPQGERPSDASFKDAKEKVVEAFTRDFMSSLYARCAGNISEMARQSGLNRNYVARLVARYGLKS